jgi:predicted homoserine dehydrogenase-like protein
LTPEQAARGGLNPKMFNSFLDGSKPSIECTAVSNATGLHVPSNGLLYPPASVEDIPFVTRPQSEGGVLERKGMVEVISSLEADGRVIPYDIRMGVWVTVEAETDYIKNCFEEYNAHTDPSGRYFTLYKRWHLIGLEVGMSVASVALRGEATGVAQAWHADVVATAKRDLNTGEMLDGEGGSTVWGKLLPAKVSAAKGGLPLGLAHQVKLVRDVKKGQSLCWDDVAMDTSLPAYKIRKEMESLFPQ